MSLYIVRDGVNGRTFVVAADFESALMAWREWVNDDDIIPMSIRRLLNVLLLPSDRDDS